METEFSVDDVFDYLIKDFQKDIASSSADAASNLQTERLKAAYKKQIVPFILVQQDTATKLQYREIALPW